MLYYNNNFQDFGNKILEEVRKEFANTIDNTFRAMCQGDFHDTEKVFLNGFMDAMRTTFGKILEATDIELTSHRKPSDYIKSIDSRQVTTSFGLVQFNHRRYKNQEKGQSYLLDKAIGLPGGARVTPFLVGHLASTASDESYRRTLEAISPYVNWNVSPTTVMNSVRQIANLVKSDLNNTSQAYWEKCESVGHKKAKQLLFEADGIYVPRQRNKSEKKAKIPKSIEIKNGKAYPEKEKITSKNGRKKKVCKDPIFYATAESKDAFFTNLVGKTMSVYDFKFLERGYLGTDGEPSYINGISYFGENTENVLDLFHITKKVNEKITRKGLRKKIKNLIKKDNNLPMAITMSEQWRDKQTADSEKGKVQELITYLTNNQDIIDPTKPRMGTLESTNGHVIADRMKRFGGGWSLLGADSMATIRATLQGGDKLPKLTREFNPRQRVKAYVHPKPEALKPERKHNPHNKYLQSSIKFSDPKLDAIMNLRMQ